MLNIILLVIHSIVSLLLILFILLHSGRGTGLSDMFGGGGGAVGTSGAMEKNLDRITVVTSVVFGMTTLLLGLTLS